MSAVEKQSGASGEPSDSSSAATQRATRRCARCGREGRNAYRSLHADVGGTLWVCTHEETCVERTRLVRRAAARTVQGRPSQSPIVALPWEARRACVIGSDPASRHAIVTALGDFGGIEAEGLDLKRRSLELLSSRDFGLIVADVRAVDPVAMLGELARRLSGVSRRGVPVIIAYARSDGERPAIEALIRRCGAYRLMRPVDGAALLAMVDALIGLGSTGSSDRAAS
jgi:hypothetical protein